MWIAINIINYVENFTPPVIREAHFPKYGFKNLEVKPDPDDWSMVVHRLTPAQDGHIYYAGGLRPPVWADQGLARLMYLAVNEGAGRAHKLVTRNKDLCSDRLCVNPAHMMTTWHGKTETEHKPQPAKVQPKPTHQAEEPNPKPKQNRTCETSRKITYATEQLAQDAANGFRKRAKGMHNRKNISVYRCTNPFCALWHITTHPEK